MDQPLCSYYTFPSARSPEKEEETTTKTPTLEEVGGKGLSLIETCCNGGFPVPPGLVLTVYFFEPWMAKVTETSEWSDFMHAAVITKDHCDAVKSACKQHLKEFSARQQEQLGKALHQVFGKQDDVGILAVRSSSPEEDLVGSSFAGAYETTLGVRNGQGLCDAIVNSFASMFDYRIVQYKLQQQQDGMMNKAVVKEPRIAVVLQRQIASDVSGVAFGINPHNNCYDEVMISANFGLGETVVSGTVSPDVYIVDRFNKQSCTILSKTIHEKTLALWLNKSDEDNMSNGGTHYETPINPTGQALSDEQILQVAALVARVEDFRNDGVPVDIEWAIQGNKLFLLQARPVTAYIPLFPEMITPRGERKNLYMDLVVSTQGFSEPFSVMGLDLWFSFLKKVKPQFDSEGSDGLTWNVGGRQYVHMSNLFTTIGARKIMSADASVARVLNSIDIDGEYLPSEMPAGLKGMFWKQLNELFGLWLPGVIRALFAGDKVMVDYDRASEALFTLCQDEDYMRDEALDKVLATFMDKYYVVFSKAGGLVAAMYSSWRLDSIFSQLKDDDKKLLVSLKMDLSANPTSAMGHAMTRLASYPEVQQTKTSEEFVQKLKRTNGGGGFSDEFMTLYHDFIKCYGCRGMKEIDIATPRTAEKEADLFQQLKQIDLNFNAINNVTERRQEAYDKLLKLAQDIGYEKSFKHHAAIAQALLGYREHPKYMYVVVVSMFRRRALRIGEMLVKQGRLEHVEQIFDLTFDQITEAQLNPEQVLSSIIEANLRPYKATERVKNWPLFIDSRGRIIREPRKEYNAKEGQLWGDPISPGVVKGKARVLNEPYETPLLAGEILVARFTEPSWTPIFINAAGVVMEVGNALQHGAVIAREYGLPCVSGVDNATTIIKNGDELEVDGSTGLVTILNLASKKENVADGGETNES